MIRSYHICTRTLIPSMSKVFILKSTPERFLKKRKKEKKRVELGFKETNDGRSWEEEDSSWL